MIRKIFIILFIVYLWFLLYNKMTKPTKTMYIKKEDVMYEPIQFKEKGKWKRGEIVR